jgi:hypothetical protein
VLDVAMEMRCVAMWRGSSPGGMRRGDRPQRDAARRQAPAAGPSGMRGGGWPLEDAPQWWPHRMWREGGGQLAPAGEEAGLAGEPAAAARLG